MAQSRRASRHPDKSDVLEHMSEVLAAEARVRLAVAACREDLNRQLEATQEWARARQRRLHARLTRLQTVCNQGIAARIAELRRRARAMTPTLEIDPREREFLEQAVERLADRLIGRRDG